LTLNAENGIIVVVAKEESKMNYNNSISDQVKLSSVLDELILDGTDSNIIVEFLKQHEQDIPDIYKHSAFVFDLYDVCAHPRMKIDGFLVKQIRHLPPMSRYFATTSLFMLCLNTGTNDHAMTMLKDEFKANRGFYNGLDRMRRFTVRGEEPVLLGCVNLVEFLDGMDDLRDMEMFVSNSYLAMSAFQASAFVRLTPATQYYLLKACMSFTRQNHGHEEMDVVGQLAKNLVKQLAVLGHLDLLAWVLNVLGGASRELASSFLLDVPKSIVDLLGTSFEEVVFESNMQETQYDPMDLFLYIYLARGDLFKGMQENKDLLEFFNLPFNTDELKWGDE